MATIPVSSQVFIPNPLTNVQAFESGARVGPALDPWTQGVRGLLDGLERGQNMSIRAQAANDQYGQEAQERKRREDERKERATQVSEGSLQQRRLESDRSYELGKERNETMDRRTEIMAEQQRLRVTQEGRLANRQALTLRDKRKEEERKASVEGAIDHLSRTGNPTSLLAQLEKDPAGTLQAMDTDTRRIARSEMTRALQDGRLGPREKELATKFLDYSTSAGKAIDASRNIDQSINLVSESLGISTTGGKDLIKEGIKVESRAGATILTLPDGQQRALNSDGMGLLSKRETEVLTAVDEINQHKKQVDALAAEQAKSESTPGMQSGEEVTDPRQPQSDLPAKEAKDRIRSRLGLKNPEESTEQDPQQSEKEKKEVGKQSKGKDSKALAAQAAARILSALGDQDVSGKIANRYIDVAAKKIAEMGGGSFEDAKKDIKSRMKGHGKRKQRLSLISG